jgi:hypothetical protein
MRECGSQYPAGNDREIAAGRRWPFAVAERGADRATVMAKLNDRTA